MMTIRCARMPGRTAIGAMLLVAGAVFSGPAAAADTIRFGAPLPITGPLSPEAQKQQRGYDLWAETANKAGGIKVGDKRMKVEIVYVDYQSNTARAVQATERLITQDKVNFLFAPFGSGASPSATGSR
jgi:branched-chain amino acid transport system substrate-binding protein